jgi:serine/threonine protein kinase
MATFRPPFTADNLQSLKRKIIIGKTERIPLMYSDQLEAFIKKCLILNPIDRPSANDLLGYKIVKQFSEKLIIEPVNIDS